MFDPNSAQSLLQHQQQSGGSAYMVDKKSADKTTADFPFSYNVNVLKNSQVSGKNMDRFDINDPSFCYNYALVNQMSLAAAASTVQTYPCDVCGLVFGHLALLNNHKRVHINESMDNRFCCSLCNSSFSLESDLKAHKQQAHQQIHQMAEKKTSVSCGVQTEEKHTTKAVSECSKCNHKQQKTKEKFKSQPESKKHDDEGQIIYPKGYYPVKKKRMATVAKCHKCDGAGVVVVDTNPPAPEKRFQCNVCDSAFATYSSLWSHRRLHSGDKPYKCEVCGVAFARAAYLKNHGRVHTGERPFKCNVCNMQFSQSAHLKNHERIHSGERPYECDICSKTFARHSTLWNHRRIHTGEKPYECGICGSSFNQATHLRNHVKVHTGEKQFSCDVCNVGFSDRFALKRHRAVHEKFNQTAPGQPLPTDWSKLPQPNPFDNDLYKCIIPSSVAFPGCSRPPDK